MATDVASSELSSDERTIQVKGLIHFVDFSGEPNKYGKIVYALGLAIKKDSPEHKLFLSTMKRVLKHDFTENDLNQFRKKAKDNLHNPRNGCFCDGAAIYAVSRKESDKWKKDYIFVKVKRKTPFHPDTMETFDPSGEHLQKIENYKVLTGGSVVVVTMKLSAFVFDKKPLLWHGGLGILLLKQGEMFEIDHSGYASEFKKLNGSEVSFDQLKVEEEENGETPESPSIRDFEDDIHF